MRKGEPGYVRQPPDTRTKEALETRQRKGIVVSQLGYHVYRSHQPQEMKAFYFQGQKHGANTRATIHCALPLCWECNIHSLLHCVLTITF